jgi:hypothetical protein
MSKKKRKKKGWKEASQYAASSVGGAKESIDNSFNQSASPGKSPDKEEVISTIPASMFGSMQPMSNFNSTGVVPPSKMKAMMEKLKPRDFSAEPKLLSLLNCKDYDR